MYRLLRLVLVMVLASLLLIIVWSLDRGLDITDESMSLLLYLHPDDYPSNFSMYHLLVSRVTRWMHPTVLAYRWLTLALTVLAALIFASGFCQWLRRFFPTEPSRAVNLTLVFPFLLIGLLSPYGIGVRTLNYNSINSAFLFSASGLLLYTLSRAPLRGAEPVTVALALFVVGVFSALDVFVKFPTAVIMFGGALLLTVLHTRRRGPLEIALTMGILTLGAMSGLAVYFAGEQSMAGELSRYRTLIQAISESAHNPRSILRSYASDGESLVLVLIRYFWFVFLLSFVIARCYACGWHRKTLRNQYVLVASLVATLLYAGYKMHSLNLLDSPYLNGYTTFYTYVLIVCAEVIVVVATYRTAPPVSGQHRIAARRSGVLLGIALLAALPFAGAIGTNNNIFLNAMFGIGAWFALIMVLGLFIEERMGSGRALAACILLTTCFGASQVTYGMVWQPYLLAAPLPDQTVTLHQPAGVARLRVDSATAEFIIELRSTLRQGSFREHDYILGLYNVPGLVYLMGGVSPGTATYFGAEHARNCRALATVDFGKRPVFLLATRDVAPEIMTCMQKAGLPYPEEFVELGRIRNPYSTNSYGWRASEQWVRVFRRNERR